MKQDQINGYIYFFKIKNKNIVKIGVSKNPKRRKKAVYSDPSKLDIIRTIGAKYPYRAEEKLHDYFENKRLEQREYGHKEWFNLTRKEVMSINEEDFLYKEKVMDKLKSLRLEAGLTQMKLAAKVGVSLTTIRNWENGVSNPNDENMEKLKEVLQSELNRSISA